MKTTDKERRAYVEAFHASGVTAVIFCSLHKLKPKTFDAWLKRYPINFEDIKLYDSLKPASFGPSSFIPLQIAEDSKPACVLPKQPITLSLKTRNFCLDFPLNMQENFADFKRIVQALHDLV